MKSPLTLSLTSTALTVIALILILLIPLCSIRSDPNHLSTLQFATIDASATKVTVNDNEYIGLPDPYDFSKHKQIYQMYLLNYCSGYKRPGSKELVIDFCSKNGKEVAIRGVPLVQLILDVFAGSYGLGEHPQTGFSLCVN